ncbi:MAG: hypothetical protein H7196_00770 [candidate division SR1 bacterium]|nr:hypothetical protein [candidate division SR1 bacterium]
MSDSKPLIPDKLNYSAEIENIKKDVAINKQVEGWIAEAVKKAKGEMEEKANSKFWSGFLVGLIVALVIVFFWRK